MSPSNGIFHIQTRMLVHLLSLPKVDTNFPLSLGLHKYSETVYEACIRSFYSLPVAALVDGRFFCVHGGISPLLITLNDILSLDRFQEPGSRGLLCDLLWADPISKIFGYETENGVAPGTNFIHNDTRGCSYFYT
jgi:serine/threonine-protein phosphatase 2B catalytic subunit